MTWPEIAKLTPYKQSALRRRFRDEMMALGIVKRDTLGPGKRRMVWAFPADIRRYFMEKAQRGEL